MALHLGNLVSHRIESLAGISRIKLSFRVFFTRLDLLGTVSFCAVNNSPRVLVGGASRVNMFDGHHSLSWWSKPRLIYPQRSNLKKFSWGKV
jgi:hypothetical protein